MSLRSRRSPAPQEVSFKKTITFLKNRYFTETRNRSFPILEVLHKYCCCFQC